MFPWEETFIDSGSSCTQSNFRGLRNSRPREKDLVVCDRHPVTLGEVGSRVNATDKFGQERWPDRDVFKEIKEGNGKTFLCGQQENACPLPQSCQKLNLGQGS